MKPGLTVASVAWALLLFNVTGCSQFRGAITSLTPPKKADIETELKIARVQERQGKLRKAREMYEEIYRRDPKNLEACHRLAIVLTRTEDFELATKYFQEAIQLSPHNSDLLSDYGYALYLQGDLDGAERILRRSMLEDANNKRTINNLALVMGHKGHPEESLALFRKVVSEAEANANLAYIHVQRGEGSEAVRLYSHALSLDSNLDSALHAMVQLGEMQQQLETLQIAQNRQPQQSEPIAKPGSSALEGDAIVVAERPNAAQNPPASNQKSLNQESQDSIVHRAAFFENENPIPPAPADAPALPPISTARAIPDSDRDDAFSNDSFNDDTFTSDAFRLPAPSDTATTQSEPTEPSRQPAEIAAPALESAPQADSAIANVELLPSPEPVAAAESIDLVRLCPHAEGEVLRLLETVDHQNLEELVRTIQRLEQLGDEADTAVPALKILLSHDDPYVQIYSTRALWAITEETDELLIPVLVEALRHEDHKIRLFASVTLRDFDLRAEEIVPALRQALSDDNPFVRLQSAEALGKFPEWKAEATAVLLDCLQRDDADLRWIATYSLATLRPSTDRVVQVLSTKLQDSDSRVRAGAAFALGEIGPPAMLAVPHLHRALQDNVEEVREAVERAIGRIDDPLAFESGNAQTTLNDVPTDVPFPVVQTP